MPEVRAVSFDVGGTLIDPWPSVGHVYAAVAAETGLPALNPEAVNAHFAAAWKARGEFDYSLRAWRRLVEETFREWMGKEALPEALFPTLFDRFRDPGVWKIYADVHPTLERLQHQGLRLAVVSNWDDRLRPLLRALGLEAYFEVLEISAESGYHKPSPEIFRRMVSGLGLEPGQVLHVGDSAREDGEGARAAGLQAVLLRRNGGSGAGGEIGSLLELKVG